MSRSHQERVGLVTENLGDGVLPATFQTNDLGLFRPADGPELPAAEALEFGAIDEIVDADMLVDRAAERARELAARPTEAIAAIKRAVNVGGSLPLAKGLHLERTEFLASLPQRQAQELMLGYLRDTTEHGELLVYRDEGYQAALRSGRAAANVPAEA